jgi:hypothetical protein
MVVVDMKPMTPKVIEKMFVYRLKVLLVYQKILNPKGVQTLEEGKVKGNKELYEGGRWKCIVINMMVVTQNNEL